MKIKICGMRQAENIAAIDQFEPDYLGFIFYPPSPRFVEDHTVCHLATNATKVAVMVNPGLKEVQLISSRTGIKTIQLHGYESPDFCFKLKSAGFTVIKAVAVAKKSDLSGLQKFKGATDFLLFDTAARAYGGSGISFRWQWLSDYDGQIPFFLSGGISSNEAQKISRIRHEQLFGIDINSRFEQAPGLKNTELIKTFLHELRSN